MCSVKLEDNEPVRLTANHCGTNNNLLHSQTSRVDSQLSVSEKKGFSSIFVLHGLCIALVPP